MRTDGGWTPAHHASFMGHMDALSVLMDHGANLELANDEQINAYGHMIKADHVELFELFYDEAMKVDMRRDLATSPHSLVHLAASNIGPRCLSVMLARQKDANQRRQLLTQVNNYTDMAQPLHFSAVSANIMNARLIL